DLDSVGVDSHRYPPLLVGPGFFGARLRAAIAIDRLRKQRKSKPQQAVRRFYCGRMLGEERMGLPEKVASSVAVALALAMLKTGAAAADETRLLFATLAPAEYTSVTQVFMPWAERINAAGKGVLQIDVRNGMSLASNANVYDRVDADVIQIAVGIPGLVGGKFPLTEVVGLPFVADDAENGPVAYWRLYKTGLLDTEYKDIVPLALSMYQPQGVHLA